MIVQWFLIIFENIVYNEYFLLVRWEHVGDMNFTWNSEKY